MSEQCHDCRASFTDFKELARHIISNKRTHSRRSIIWAEKFLTNATFLNQKKDIPQGRIQLTEQEKQNKIDTQRPLSGVEKSTMCFCLSCKSIHPMKIPVEFLQSPMAWKQNNKVIATCMSCRSRH